MKFCLFYEIPVDATDPLAEYRAYQNTLEQAVLADSVGFHSFMTVEHHFLKRFSHCSNPEVLYGAVAARTRNIRLGYGVRLMPRPYNHPIRSAESAAVLDLISGGRVDFGTGRSATRIELEGFGIDPADTRAMWQEAIQHVVGAWTNDEYGMDGKYWQSPPRPVIPKPLQVPHPPVFAATTSMSGHEVVGELGLGLFSFTVGLPPEQLGEHIAIYRKAQARCTRPLGKFLNDQACGLTMVNCAPTNEESYAVAKESFEWYPAHSSKLVASVAQWQEERKAELGTYDYTRNILELSRGGALDNVPFSYLKDSGAVLAGDPDEVTKTCKRYEAAGCDTLICLTNPLKIPHDKVMQTIELMGKYVIPEFKNHRPSKVDVRLREN
jgi:alkanesulfonate monooxygenase SsuD/methylene tetrahydromethanopterin reductase-like flavin-dependent oxidoreductase (luciferase family)